MLTIGESGARVCQSEPRSGVQPTSCNMAIVGAHAQRAGSYATRVVNCTIKHFLCKALPARCWLQPKQAELQTVFELAARHKEAPKSLCIRLRDKRALYLRIVLREIRLQHLSNDQSESCVKSSFAPVQHVVPFYEPGNILHNRISKNHIVHTKLSLSERATVHQQVLASARRAQYTRGPSQEANMSINKESDIAANLQIGPTTLGMVRIYIEADGVEIPLDFDPDEADEIAEEIKAAAARARKIK